MVQTATAPTATPENPTAIFDTAIADAERLLELFDKLSKPEQQANEVLKRAALVMTLTVWENFIESWMNAQVYQKLTALKCSFGGKYIQTQVKNTIYHLNKFLNLIDAKTAAKPLKENYCLLTLHKINESEKFIDIIYIIHKFEQENTMYYEYKQ